MSLPISIVIAGSTGLVGHSALISALAHEHINYVYSLSRRAIDLAHHKLIQWVEPTLTPPATDTILPIPTVGVIALGTTIKQAGSKADLHAIDVELVIKVAKQFHSIGVHHLIIVSCIGASINSTSHYLRCKGEMELAIQQLEFSQITFLQPGPLAGHRVQQRTDEKLLQYVMKVINPLMIGRLANYKPIQASDVARVIIQLATHPSDIKDKQTKRITTTQMLKLIN